MSVRKVIQNLNIIIEIDLYIQMLKTPSTVVQTTLGNKQTKETTSARVLPQSSPQNHMANAETAPFSIIDDHQSQRYKAGPSMMNKIQSNSSVGLLGRSQASSRFQQSSQALHAVFKAQHNQRSSSYRSARSNQSSKDNKSQSPTQRKGVPSHIVKTKRVVAQQHPQKQQVRNHNSSFHQPKPSTHSSNETVTVAPHHMRSLSFQGTGQFSKGEKMTVESALERHNVVQTMQNTGKQHPTWFINAASSCSDISNLKTAMVYAPPSNTTQSQQAAQDAVQQTLLMPRARTFYDNRIVASTANHNEDIRQQLQQKMPQTSRERSFSAGSRRSGGSRTSCNRRKTTKATKKQARTANVTGGTNTPGIMTLSHTNPPSQSRVRMAPESSNVLHQYMSGNASSSAPHQATLASVTNANVVSGCNPTNPNEQSSYLSNHHFLSTTSHNGNNTSNNPLSNLNQNQSRLLMSQQNLSNNLNPTQILAAPPTLSFEEQPSRYGSINNYQPLLSNFNRSQTNDDYLRYDNNNSVALSPNFIIDEEAKTEMAAVNQSTSEDLLLSQRLEELVSEANRFRTKACGMGVYVGRSANVSASRKNSKIPGSTVTQDQIDDQRRERKSRTRKPPVPKANKQANTFGMSTTKLIHLSNSTLATATSRPDMSMRSETQNTNQGATKSTQGPRRKQNTRSQDRLHCQQQRSQNSNNARRQTWKSTQNLMPQEESQRAVRQSSHNNLLHI